MNDRDLIELAAKAAGLTPGRGNGEYAWHPVLGCLVSFNGPKSRAEWNPLADDGDALRLAVKLQFDILVGAYWVIIDDDGKELASESISPDPHAAARRAIVRAAADIGAAGGSA